MDRSAIRRIRSAIRAGLPALALLAALGLSGCGATGDQDASPSPTTAPTGPGDADTGTTGAPAPPPASAAAGTSTGTPVSPSDPCGLITQQEAERLAGTSLDSPAAVDETCTYTAPPSGPTAQVEVRVGQTALDYYSAERGSAHKLVPLAGVGDEAHIGEYMFYLVKNGHQVSVKLVRGNDPAENRGPLENLARTVAGRL
ncbi:hypothetical protein UG55_103317 [Frankia sp. EI5c]|uniref:hypothetical protein n=1 Tax=Frankia sp. EI5c TaxID=683316 RepID=UPI0007C24165|nr:hypothetical protein [Frankia sp. EI5c]OAA23875.1 hypothetical protein UG55_103317 [Frankia sp. EI5c]